MEMKRIYAGYNGDVENLGHTQNINGFPLQINKLNNTNNYYENVEKFSSRLKEKVNKNLIINEGQRDHREYEMIESPNDNRLQLELDFNNNNNNEINDNMEYVLKKQASNETIDLNFYINHFKKIEKKNAEIKSIDDTFIHRKFDSLHAFYIESIRLMSKK